jgi:hypothetical protein
LLAKIKKTTRNKIMDKKKNFKFSGILLLLLSIYFFFMRRDIFLEVITGRDLDQINIGELLLPLILLIISILTLYKSK